MAGHWDIAPDLVWEELDGEVVIAAPAQKSIWVLNSTGTEIWGQVRRGVSLEAYSRRLARELNVDARKVLAEVAGFCRQLSDYGLLKAGVRSVPALAFAAGPGRRGVLLPAPVAFRQGWLNTPVGTVEPYGSYTPG